MKTRHRVLSASASALVALALLPLRTDGGQAECCNVAGSLASSIAQPVSGDEDFFTLPTGPSAVMFLLDNSGSMTDLPQCADGMGSAPCTYPTLAAAADPPLGGAPTASGTCDVAGTGRAWMAAITPTRTHADPGFTGVVSDSPPWSAPNCTGNACLFDPDAYYHYDSWTETSATPFTLQPCSVLDASGNPVIDRSGNPVTIAACQTCMDQRGFYFLREIKYRRASDNTVVTVSFQSNNHPDLRLRGTWLNANPPKFVMARRAVKQLLRIADGASLQPRDLVRFGLSTFANTDANNATWNNSNNASTAMRDADGAKLVVPLGPNCDQANPASPSLADIVAAREGIIAAINSTSRPIRFANYTPLAEALFNIGQYFSDIGNSSAYATRFGASWMKQSATYPGQDFRETSVGDAGAVWADGSHGRQASICWACQQSAVILVTDGMPNNENNLPATGSTTTHATQPRWDFRYWTPTDYRTACGGNRGGTGDQCGSYLPLVASYLRNQDQRLADSASAGLQNVNTHTVSFGITDTQALRVLDATATVGGGTFSNTSNYDQLLAGIQRAVNAVVQRSTAFSATAANSLQTSQTSATETFLARFRPTAGKAYEGHLYQAVLFDEFANGCDSKVGPTDQPRVACGSTTVYPNLDQNVDDQGHNVCTGAHLVDLDCDIIAEDSLGNFIKKRTASDPTPTPARMVWDAGRVLSDPSQPGHRSAVEADAGGLRARNIFTWVNGTRVPFTTANLATLQPMMALDAATCSTLLSSVGFTVAGMTASDVLLNCARQVVYYVRGYDVFDQNGNGCSAPGNPRNVAACPSGEERNTSAADVAAGRGLWKMGDIFHSSPAVVKPPVDEVRCDLGFDSQCLPVIHSPSGLGGQTPIATYAGATGGTTVDAYERWRLDSNGAQTNRSRKRIVVAGANDGMLHAFDAGDADTSRLDVFGSYAYGYGTGEELWAFIPPDLLPRLKLLLTSSLHQYMVDGPTMVRDVWVDANGDGTKQRNEFHTLAVVSERAGGTQFTGLNLDDPLNPTMLWTFPEPCSDDAALMAESWTDFAPRPPPIGPVKIAKASDARGYEERWVVALNGGYDPAMLKGRAVFLVDAWTGRRLWRFTDDDFKASVAAQNSSATSLWPVPGGMALLDVGDPRRTLRDADGFFDTATWGDLGGQLWVARFHAPGLLDASGHVTNWFAARTFEQQRRVDGEQWITSTGASTPPNEVRGSFYFMTSNVYDSVTRTLRTFAGTGNREAMLVQDVSCGPNNVMGCAQAGCSVVDTTTVDTWGTCTATQHFRFENGRFTRDATATNCGATASCGTAAGDAVTSTTTFHVQCGTFTTSPDVVSRIRCDSSGSCSTYQPVGSGRNVDRSFLRDPQTHNRFYGVWSYGKDPRKMFDSLAEARAFDANRFTDVAHPATCTGPAGGSCRLVDATQALGRYDTNDPTGSVSAFCVDNSARCWANSDDAGWYYEYGRVCPSETCSPPPPWEDEKTSSGGTVVFGCSIWTGFRPLGSSGAVNPCDNTIGTPSVYQYGANVISGVPTRSCGYDGGEGIVYRSADALKTWAPPNEPKIRVVVNERGQVAYSALDVGNPGAPPVNRRVKQRLEVAEPIYWLEVPRDLHQCRHADATYCK